MPVVQLRVSGEEGEQKQEICHLLLGERIVKPTCLSHNRPARACWTGAPPHVAFPGIHRKLNGSISLLKYQRVWVGWPLASQLSIMGGHPKCFIYFQMFS